MRVGIDCYSEDALNTARRLGKLVGVEVMFVVKYVVDSQCSMIHIETNKSLTEIEDWLYRTEGIEYIGVYEISPEEEN